MLATAELITPKSSHAKSKIDMKSDENMEYEEIKKDNWIWISTLKWLLECSHGLRMLGMDTSPTTNSKLWIYILYNTWSKWQPNRNMDNTETIAEGGNVEQLECDMEALPDE